MSKARRVLTTGAARGIGGKTGRGKTGTFYFFRQARTEICRSNRVEFEILPRTGD